MKRYLPLTPPRRVLVVCMRRIGDVLTVTPLLRSLRRAWPEARIEVLVPSGTAPVLQGNPDIDEVLVEPAGSRRQRLGLLARLWRRYDLAVGTQYNDRPYLYTLAAARRRVMIVPHAGLPGARLKRRFVDGWCELSLGREHAVEQYLALADVLGLSRCAQVVPPQPADDDALQAMLGVGWTNHRWAVVHPSPMYRYKAWTLQGWVAAIRHLTAEHGLGVVLSGGPAEADRLQAAAIVEALDESTRAQVHMACGRLSLAEMALLLQKAVIYLGPDTSITHLAAASGTRTLALYGPSHPVAWGPWPQGGAREGVQPWEMKAPLQRRERIWLIQGEGDCVPCLAEGCERHVNSRSDCLELLAPARVARVIDQALLDDPDDPRLA